MLVLGGGENMRVLDKIIKTIQHADVGREIHYVGIGEKVYVDLLGEEDVPTFKINGIDIHVSPFLGLNDIVIFYVKRP